MHPIMENVIEDSFILGRLFSSLSGYSYMHADKFVKFRLMLLRHHQQILG